MNVGKLSKWSVVQTVLMFEILWKYHNNLLFSDYYADTIQI